MGKKKEIMGIIVLQKWETGVMFTQMWGKKKKRMRKRGAQGLGTCSHVLVLCFGF